MVGVVDEFSRLAAKRLKQRKLADLVAITVMESQIFAFYGFQEEYVDPAFLYSYLFKEKIAFNPASHRFLPL